jgi:hypothetical protein
MGQADRRHRFRAAAAARAAGLGGWFPSALNDAITESGEACHWDTCEHLDGRQATVFPDGRCTNPELQVLLAKEAEAMPPPPGFPWWARLAMTVARRWQKRSGTRSA